MNIQLYNDYMDAKTRVAVLQEQIQTLNQQLYTAENTLIDLKAQVDVASNDALLSTLV